MIGIRITRIILAGWLQFILGIQHQFIRCTRLRRVLVAELVRIADAKHSLTKLLSLAKIIYPQTEQRRYKPAAKENMKHKEFEVHILNPEGIEKAKRIATVFDNVLSELESLCIRAENSGGILLPRHLLNDREMNTVKYHLETASFFAKKAMVVLPENQKSAAQSA